MESERGQAGASREMRKTAVLLDCRANRGIRFTVRFGERITIRANGTVRPREPKGRPAARGQRQDRTMMNSGEDQRGRHGLRGTRASANTSGSNLNPAAAGEIADEQGIRTE